MSKTMFEMADLLKELKNTKKQIESDLKDINKSIEETEMKLSEMMVNTETQSFNRSGTLFYLNTKLYASAKADQKIELFETLKQEGFGSLITETINANSLAAFVREQMEANDDVLPEWLEGKVNVFDKVAVGLRKSK